MLFSHVQIAINHKSETNHVQWTFKGSTKSLM